MSRIAARFASLKTGKRTALIPYITAGDPHPALTVPLMRALVEAGADIVTTNTFTATPVSQADYGLDGLVYEPATRRLSIG